MSNMIDKILRHKYWWLALLLALAGVNYLASVFHHRIDLTGEKRFTLSHSTRQMLGKLDDQVNVEVYLKGSLQPGFKKLAASTEEILQECKDYSRGRLSFSFVDPFENLADTNKIMELGMMGLQPYSQESQSREGDETVQRTLLPGALVSYRGKKAVVNLFRGLPQDEATLYNNAEALLEYNFASTLDKLVRRDTPSVAYLLGNGELGQVPADRVKVADAIRTLAANYRTDTFNLTTHPFIPGQYDAIVLNKPTSKFSDGDKLKLEQYLLRGGNIFLLMDNLMDSRDSLSSASGYIAYDRGLNLEDLLFKFGVRVNQDMIQDMQCSQILSVVGTQGDKPQLKLIEWPYFPLLVGTSHPISLNMDPVLSQFVGSIDTVQAPGIKKSILLTSSARARTLATPAEVSLNNVRELAASQAFNRSYIPVAVLLEGKFSPLYANRITAAALDSLKAANYNYLAAASKAGKLIVVSDGDIIKNDFSPERGIQPMGFNSYINYKFANDAFFTNCLEYMLGNSAILDTRSKRYTQRSLNPDKVERNRFFWQFVNLVLPILLIVLFGAGFQYWRKRKYQGV